MNYNEIKEALEEIKKNGQFEIIDDEMNDSKYKSNYLGSFMSLDPCGRYHNIISPNGMKEDDVCFNFWEDINKASEDIGGWIQGGEGDPTDIYLCFPMEDK